MCIAFYAVLSDLIIDALELMVLHEWTDQSLLDKTFPYVATVQCSCIIQEIVVKK